MSPSSKTPATSDGWTRFFRNPTTNDVVIAQWPNLPLAIFLAATLVRTLFSPEGSLATVASIAASVGLVWWAVDEIARGESPFRRLLGAVVLLGWVASMVLRFQ